MQGAYTEADELLLSLAKTNGKALDCLFGLWEHRREITSLDPSILTLLHCAGASTPSALLLAISFAGEHPAVGAAAECRHQALDHALDCLLSAGTHILEEQVECESGDIWHVYQRQSSDVNAGVYLQ